MITLLRMFYFPFFTDNSFPFERFLFTNMFSILKFKNHNLCRIQVQQHTCNISQQKHKFKFSSSTWIRYGIQYIVRGVSLPEILINADVIFIYYT